MNQMTKISILIVVICYLSYKYANVVPTEYNTNGNNFITSSDTTTKFQTMDDLCDQIKLAYILNNILSLEGGYSNNSFDNGGETNFGITRKLAISYGYADVKSITKKNAIEIMQKEFWDKYNISKIRNSGYEKLSYCMLDFAITSGYNSIKVFQKQLGVDDDMIIGDSTISIMKQYTEQALIDSLKVNRLQYNSSLSVCEHFGEGWEKRVNTIHNLIDNF